MTKQSMLPRLLSHKEIIRVVYATIQADATVRGISLPINFHELDPIEQKFYTDMTMYLIRNPTQPHEQVYNEWYFSMCNEGWVYGESFCTKEKTHPDLRPYENLPYRIRLQHMIAHQVVNVYLAIK